MPVFVYMIIVLGNLIDFIARIVGFEFKLQVIVIFFGDTKCKLRQIISSEADC